MRTKTIIKNKNKIFVFIMSVFSITTIVNAQPFQMTGLLTNRFGVTTTMGANNVRAIGVGAFTSTNRPLSAFHINTSLLTASPDFTAGEVFRTTSNATGSNFNAWRMFTGTGAGTEKFAVLNDPNHTITTNNVILQATQPGAIMQFNVGGTFLFGQPAQIPRMVITDGSFFGNTGLIGMGNGFLNPTSQLHLNDGTFATYLQITNASTNPSGMLLNPTATDGFKIGIAANGTAELLQQENSDMNFHTGISGNSRIVVKGVAGTTQGYVGIGQNFTAPQSILHLHSQPAIPNGTKTYMQITDGTTGVAAADGFKLGTSNGVAEVRQQENEEMSFFTNDTERMKITNEGEVQINSLQCENCFVMTDKEGKLYAKKKSYAAEKECEIANLETRIAMLEQKINELTNLLANK